MGSKAVDDIHLSKLENYSEPQRETQESIRRYLINVFLRSKTSFDEIYHTILISELTKFPRDGDTNIFDLIKLTHADLDAVL